MKLKNFFLQIILIVSIVSFLGLSSQVVTVNAAGVATDIRKSMQESDPNGYFTNGRDDVGIVISSVVNFVLTLGALATLFYLVWGGVDWLTAGGDAETIKKARNKMTGAVVGLTLLAISFAVWVVLINFLNLGGAFDLTTNGGPVLPPCDKVPSGVQCI